MTSSSIRFTKIYVRGSTLLKQCRMPCRPFQTPVKKMVSVLVCALAFMFSSHFLSLSQYSAQQNNQFLATRETTERYPTYDANPVSSSRPINQFSFGNSFCRNEEHLSQPLLTIFTVTRNPRSVMTETASFIRSQSFCALRWVIISDHSTERNSFRLLENIASQDVRITLLNSSFSPGFPNGKNLALEQIKLSPTPYFTFLDDDDMFELTAYEKLIWLMESNRHLHMAGYFVVGYGEKNYTWVHGFHDGSKVYTGSNPLTSSAVLRTNLLFETPCRFDSSLISGMEDWDLYLCLAAHERWGSTVPEYLFWYRQNPMSLKKQRWSSMFEDEEKTVAYIRAKYEKLSSDFPVPYQKQMIPEHINMTIPFANKLTVEHGAMFILSSEDILDCNTNAMQTIISMSRNGQRVTVVNTAVKMKDFVGTLHRCVMLPSSTHDIFDIPAIINVADVPRFLSYLITSRSIDRLFVSRKCYARSLLPWLAKFHRNIKLYTLTESMSEKASKQDERIFRRLRNDFPCTSRLVESIESTRGSPPNAWPWEKVRSLWAWFWGSNFCAEEVIRATRQVLREIADTSSEEKAAYSYEQVHEFLLHL